MSEMENAQKIIDQVKSEGRDFMMEHEVKKILKDYGVDVTEEYLCKTPEEAKEKADKIGFPVVLKIVSPDVLHKSDYGGVKTSIKSPDEAYSTFEEIKNNIDENVPDAEFTGILVQEQVTGHETIIGSYTDPQFGSIMMFGLGGIFVEILEDVSYRLPPLDKLTAEEMVRDIDGFEILTGYRGEAGANIDEIVSTLQKVSNFLNDFEVVNEMDLNPTFAGEKRTVVGDARIILG